MNWVKNIIRKSSIDPLVSREIVCVPAERLLIFGEESGLADYFGAEKWRLLVQPRSKLLPWLGNTNRYELILFGAEGAAEYRWLWPHRVQLAGMSILQGAAIDKEIAQLRDEMMSAPPFLTANLQDVPFTPSVIVEGNRIVQAIFPGSLRSEWCDPRGDRREKSPTRGRGISRGESGSPAKPEASSPSIAPESDGKIKTDSLRRTPHLDLSTVGPLAPGTRFTVEVYADKQTARPGETADDIVIDAAPEEKEFKLHVSLLVSEGLVIDGPAHGEIFIRRDSDRSDSVTFALRASAFAPAAGFGTIVAAFTHNCRPSGSVLRRVALGTASLGELADGDDVVAERLELVRTAPPDLFVDIRPARYGSDRSFVCCVLSPHLPKFQDASATTTWEFPDSSDRVVADKMKMFTSQTSPAMLEAALRGAGIDLFNTAPENFRTAFWALIDSGKPFQTIFIVSAERYMPWELMVPQRGHSDLREALGVEFSVGRWVTEKHTPAPRIVSITDSLIISPRYLDADQILDHAEDEAAFVQGQFAGRRIDPAVFANLKTTFAQGGASLLHFICHGSSTETEQCLALENNESLSVDHVRGMKEIRAACRDRKSFIFLNACEVGREIPTLAGADGFAPCFIGLGASGVVAPLWSIEDNLAPSIAMDFYKEALKRPRRPFAEIMRSIRARAYGDDGKDTYAAYAFYGDPSATLAEATALTQRENPSP